MRPRFASDSFVRNALWAGLLAMLTACASTPEREAAGGDRTQDPEFEAAREKAEPEFESQADALAAGVYEPFVHPDSIAADAVLPPADGPAPTTPRVAGDPSTEELLGTLGEPAPYNPVLDGAMGAQPPRPPTDAAAHGGVWTLQMGAFGSETRAVVRIRELELDFPDLPRWMVRGDVIRVFAGRFPDREAAERARSAAVAEGYGDAWVTRVP